MKWDGDPYQRIKQDIFDIIRIELPEKQAEKITIKQAFDAIDQLIANLIKGEFNDN